MFITSSYKKIPLVIFTIFVFGIIAFLQLPQNGVQSPQPPVPVDDVDYYMKSYSIVTTDILGNAQYWFRGEDMQHFASNVTQIQQPEVTIRNAQEQIWTTRAATGEIINDEQITLDGAVQIEQVSISHPQIQIKTEQLVISLNQKTAVTERVVMVTTPRGRLNATGMQVDFANNRVKLLSGVSAQYEIE